MIRGTTPKLTFNLPFETALIKSAYITLKCESGETEIEKELCDCAVDEKSISFTLTQEDTLKLPPCAYVRMQLRVLTHGGEALASNIYKVYVEEILKDGAIE
jgi:hypothetical protein